ncbi:MAG: hypothetical protein ACLTXO_03475 [Fusobacterium varium]|uniref:hypothetical protein n=1 Tax=Fusobacterium varium TaxID=856 RepID=UPI00399413ED
MTKNDYVLTQDINTVIFKGKFIVIKKPSVKRQRVWCEQNEIPYIEIDEPEPLPNGIFEKREDGKLYQVSLETLKELNQWPYKILIGSTYSFY